MVIAGLGQSGYSGASLQVDEWGAWISLAVVVITLLATGRLK